MRRAWGWLSVLLLLLAAGPEASADTVLIRIETELGPIVAELYPDQAPLTVANFLRYVDANAYRDAQFHRTVREDNEPDDSIRIAVVQIGRNPESQRDPTFPAIPLERTSQTGLHHRDGSLSMARTGPDTGTWHFSIVIGEQPEMDFGGRRQPDGQGFAGPSHGSRERLARVHGLCMFCVWQRRPFLSGSKRTIASEGPAGIPPSRSATW
ncbi:MAG: peptidylprolyl isomerase [Gemmatimonadota bacterium]